MVKRTQYVKGKIPNFLAFSLPGWFHPYTIFCPPNNSVEVRPKLNIMTGSLFWVQTISYKTKSSPSWSKQKMKLLILDLSGCNKRSTKLYRGEKKEKKFINKLLIFHIVYFIPLVHLFPIIHLLPQQVWKVITVRKASFFWLMKVEKWMNQWAISSYPWLPSYPQIYNGFYPNSMHPPQVVWHFWSPCSWCSLISSTLSQAMLPRQRWEWIRKHDHVSRARHLHTHPAVSSPPQGLTAVETWVVSCIIHVFGVLAEYALILKMIQVRLSTYIWKILVWINLLSFQNIKRNEVRERKREQREMQRQMEVISKCNWKIIVFN